MAHTYSPKGVCSRQISFDLDDEGCVHNVQFYGGCHGNTQGLAALCEGMLADEVISRLKGIRCGMKATSCPDQLAKAIEEVW
ncbi:MAG: TIGR03905 family TSCPD domain-containing protein [Clostridia bacterium]|nr:TIGR03905 family TSCPD domain-containing protein [Clostridia bacterium]